MTEDTPEAGGSMQLRQYLALRRKGVERADAAHQTGMSLTEAQMWDADDEAGKLGWVGAPSRARAPARARETEETAVTTNVSAEMLRSFIRRIENLDEEIAGLNDDKRDVFAEAKGQGFDVKAMKAVIRRRKAGGDATSEFDALVETYERALGGMD